MSEDTKPEFKYSINAVVSRDGIKYTENYIEKYIPPSNRVEFLHDLRVKYIRCYLDPGLPAPWLKRELLPGGRLRGELVLDALIAKYETPKAPASSKRISSKQVKAPIIETLTYCLRPEYHSRVVKLVDKFKVPEGKSIRYALLAYCLKQRQCLINGINPSSNKARFARACRNTFGVTITDRSIQDGFRYLKEPHLSEYKAEIKWCYDQIDSAIFGVK